MEGVHNSSISIHFYCISIGQKSLEKCEKVSVVWCQVALRVNSEAGPWLMSPNGGDPGPLLGSISVGTRPRRSDSMAHFSYLAGSALHEQKRGASGAAAVPNPPPEAKQRQAEHP